MLIHVCPSLKKKIKQEFNNDDLDRIKNKKKSLKMKRAELL